MPTTRERDCHSNTVIKGWAVACATHLRRRSVAVAVAATSTLLVGCGSEDPAGEGVDEEVARLLDKPGRRRSSCLNDLG
jgi:hypothetical protein